MLKLYATYHNLLHCRLSPYGDMQQTCLHLPSHFRNNPKADTLVLLCHGVLQVELTQALQ